MEDPLSLSHIHLLLTYKCDSECDHCFVWSSPSSIGTMTTDQIRRVIDQAREIPSMEWVYFEGGEPFLFYPLMLKGAEIAKAGGFKVGIVTNAYWATDHMDSILWLKPLARLEIEDLSLSRDDYHGANYQASSVKRACSAARDLALPFSILSVRGVEDKSSVDEGAGNLYFRGRAVDKLVAGAPQRLSEELNSCPENPPRIERLHVDAFGNLQFCQGITIGNVWRRRLRDIIKLDPMTHPIIGPLARGGPLALARELGLDFRESYADTCHMCVELRRRLREKGRFRDILIPDQAYGEGLIDLNLE